jgi:hypothetical protein
VQGVKALQKFPAMFTLLAVILSLLVVYGVKYGERHFSGGKGALTRSDLELTEFRLEEPIAASTRPGAWKLTGRIRNKSLQYRLTHLVIGIVIKDSPTADCATVGELEETVHVKVRPGERATLEKDIYFPNLKKLSKTWSWYYKIHSMGAEAEKVSAPIP